MKKEFVVIDIYSQLDQINSLIKGFSEKDIVSWLKQKGTLQKRYLGKDASIVIYDFTSKLNRSAIFRIEVDELVPFHPR